MNINKLTNTELIKFCAHEPENRCAWTEFYARFDKYIWLNVHRTLIEKGIPKQSSQYEQNIQDSVQDVYMKIVEKNCKALKEFVGASENSIFTYLGIITRNVVLNNLIKMAAQKRRAPSKSLDDLVHAADDSEVTLKELLPSEHDEIEAFSTMHSLKEKIEEILHTFLHGKSKERNILIFKLYFYEGFSPAEIASQFQQHLSPKRINNIITTIKQILRERLIETENPINWEFLILFLSLMVVEHIGVISHG